MKKTASDITIINNSIAKYQQGNVFGFIRFIIALLIITGMVTFILYVAKLDRTIVNKFEGKHWNIPAKVYSRPLELYQGADVSQQRLDQWLQLLNYKSMDNHDTKGSYHKHKSTYHIRTRGFNFSKNDVEPEQVITLSFTNGKIRKISSDKNTSGVLRLEPVNIGGIYPDNNEDRTVVKLSDVPDSLINALITTEDRSFYEHHGVSIRGIIRAVVNNFAGKSMQGGSTLTQQLVKNFYLTSERSLKRKINEAIMAILLEIHYDKDTILQTYLNEINLGQSGSISINGFSLASEFYFNRPLNELSVDEQALLVGLAKGPSVYNPRRNPENALARRNTVLNNMLVMDTLTQEQYDSAIKQPVQVVSKPAVGQSLFPDFLDVVKRELTNFYHPDDLKNEGLIIISTLDPIVQSAADTSMNKKISQLRKLSSRSKNLEGALVSTNPQTGELVAIVGGYGTFTGYNRAIESDRQVGSLLKPIIYLNALESGKYNLASKVDDSPISVKMGNGKIWSPKNYGGRSHENVSLTQALASSYNQAAVRIGLEFGVDEVTNKLARMGINKDIEEYPSTLLGSNTLTPMQIAKIYQVFATGGFQTQPHSIRSVTDENGNVLQRSALKTKRSIKPKYNYLINYALQEVVKKGTAKRALTLGEELNLAGKTGTTNDYKDAWFAGYSGNYVSVVWVGRDDNQSIGLSGKTGALPIWVDFMKRLDLTPVNLPKPDGIEWLWLEDKDGRLSNEQCFQGRYLPVLSRHIPEEASQCAVALYESNIRAESQPQLSEQALIIAQRIAENLPAINKSETKDTSSNNNAEGNENAEVAIKTKDAELKKQPPEHFNDSTDGDMQEITDTSTSNTIRGTDSVTNDKNNSSANNLDESNTQEPIHVQKQLELLLDSQKPVQEATPFKEKPVDDNPQFELLKNDEENNNQTTQDELLSEAITQLIEKNNVTTKNVEGDSTTTTSTNIFTEMQKNVTNNNDIDVANIHND